MRSPGSFNGSGASGVVPDSSNPNVYDPYWSLVRNRFTFDGANGSTTINDLKGYAFTNTNVGSISTAQAKFGTASFNAPYNTTAQTGFKTSSAFSLGSSNFTIEGWFYLSQIVTGSVWQTIVDSRSASSDTFGIGFGIDVNGTQPTLVVEGVTTTATISAISTGVWHHFAVVRNGTNWTAYIDGVATCSTTSSVILRLRSMYFGQLAYDGGAGTTTWRTLAGYLDDMRITVGMARYTADFTPNTTALPTTGVLDGFGHAVALQCHMEGANNSTTITDSKGHTITHASGSTSVISTAASKYGSSSLLTSANSTSYVYTPSNMNFSFGAGSATSNAGDFTIEAWINPQSKATNPSYPVVFSNNATAAWGSGSWTVVWNHNSYANVLSFECYNFNNGGSALITGQTTMSTGTWYHVALVRRFSTYYLFVNGVLQGTPYTSTTSMDGGVARSLYLGKGDTGGTTYFNGYFDDVRVTRAARYGYVQVPAAAYPDVGGGDPYFANTTLLLHGDGSNGGTTFTDSSVNALTGTLTGTATTSTSVLRYGTASINMTTGNGVISYPSSLFNGYGTSDWTVEGWIYPTSTSVSVKTIVHLNAGSNNGIHVYMNNGGLYLDNGVTASINTSTTLMSANNWYHFACMNASGKTSIYINGEHQVSGTSQSYGTPSQAYIGKFQASALYWNGYLDDIRISNLARYQGAAIIPSSQMFDLRWS